MGDTSKPPTSNESYVSTALKFARLASVSKISLDEYAFNLLDSSALLSEFNDSTVQAVVDSVPGVARMRLIDEIAKVVAPGWQLRDIHYGGPGPGRVQREQTRRLYESRIRAFAEALGKELSKH
jgi:hypothetical protein